MALGGIVKTDKDATIFAKEVSKMMELFRKNKQESEEMWEQLKEKYMYYVKIDIF